ncbi:hypothetical protein DPMN_125269 [Dreissena polymorpha]|uniref:Uncharacterized protein n=1 Tax=Dreissena polymorpha TaxID=45954 RepID=A0A9D4GV33_DREPO|nr:hypothetical protein DPMN_125269 [Dreissena polymorpha]
MIHGCIIDMDFGSNIPDVDGTESEVDPTPCGRGGSLEERRCQLFKLTTLAILPAIILIVRDAVKVASDVQSIKQYELYELKYDTADLISTFTKSITHVGISNDNYDCST